MPIAPAYSALVSGSAEAAPARSGGAAVLITSLRMVITGVCRAR